MSEPRVSWTEAEEYIDEVTYLSTPDDGIVIQVGWWRARVDNAREFSASEQVGILTAAMMFDPPPSGTINNPSGDCE